MKKRDPVSTLNPPPAAPTASIRWGADAEEAPATEPRPKAPAPKKPPEASRPKPPQAGSAQVAKDAFLREAIPYKKKRLQKPQPKPEPTSSEVTPARVAARVKESTPLERSAVYLTVFLIGMVFTIVFTAAAPDGSPVASAAIAQAEGRPVVTTSEPSLLDIFVEPDEVESTAAPIVWGLAPPPGVHDLEGETAPALPDRDGEDLLGLVESPDAERAELFRMASGAMSPEQVAAREALLAGGEASLAFVERLLEAGLAHEDPHPQQMAVLVDLVAELGLENGTEWLRRIASSRMDVARQAALSQLSARKDAETFELAVASLDAELPLSRAQGIAILRMAGEAAHDALVRGLAATPDDDDDRLVDILSNFAGANVSASLGRVVVLVEVGATETRRVAAGVLASWADPDETQRFEIITALRGATRDPVPDIRRQAAFGLQTHDAGTALVDLVQLLKDESVEVRQAASRALSEITGESRGNSAYAWEQYLEERRDG